MCAFVSSGISCVGVLILVRHSDCDCLQILFNISQIREGFLINARTFNSSRRIFLVYSTAVEYAMKENVRIKIEYIEYKQDFEGVGKLNCSAFIHFG